MNWLFCLLLSLYFGVSDSSIPSDWSSEENELYELIMDYRKDRGLESIPKSKAMFTVARAHCNDLETNRTDQGRCNLHSWSKNDLWSSCCYTDDHKKASCMWEKPREITDYEGNGYEIAHWHSAGATPKTAFDGWKESPGHNKVMLNKGIWKEDWKAVGVGIVGGYATVWFGNESP